MPRTHWGAFAGTAAVAAAALVLAGCASGTPSPEPTGSTATGVTYMDTATGECAAPPAEGVDYEGALAYLDAIAAPVTGLLTDQKLPEPISSDTLVVYLDNATAYSALLSQFISEAVTAAGGSYQAVNTGLDAESINAAMNSVVTLDPDVIITFGTDLTFWQDQYKALTDGGTAIVYAGNGNATDFGLNQTFGTTEASEVNGAVLAAGAIVYTCGTAKNFVYYPAPEIVASVDMLASYEQFINDHVPGATIRSVDISIADSDPAGKIVSDLQAHPETEFCSPTADQFQIGLHAKAQLAGITNDYCFGGISLPANFAQIEDGTQPAGFAYDTAIQSWQAVDEGFRKLQGVFEDYDIFELTHLVAGIITKQNIDRVDIATGVYSALPDYQDLYLSLWNAN